MTNPLNLGVQMLALLLISLVVGAMFGIWRGYSPATWSAATFVETHQSAVRGLNVLLPLMGLGAILATAILAFLARNNPQTLSMFVIAAILMLVAGAITKLGNQPINEQIMGWTTTEQPANWAAIRDQWWGLHQMRLASGFAAELFLLLAILTGK